MPYSSVPGTSPNEVGRLFTSSRKWGRRGYRPLRPRLLHLRRWRRSRWKLCSYSIVRASSACMSFRSCAAARYGYGFTLRPSR